MAAYNDSNIGDVDPGADNYWTFVTGEATSNNPASLVGYSFDPMETYETALTVRDGAGSAAAGDGDYILDARNSSSFHPNDGVAFGGNAYHVARNWIFEAEVRYAGQTDTVTTTVVVSRIADTDNDTSEPLHSTAIVRFRDGQIQNVFNGPDGAGYPLNQIESVTLTSLVNEQSRINIGNQYDDAFPVLCFASGTQINTDQGDLAIEKLRVGDKVRTLDSGYQTIRWIGATKVSTDHLARHRKMRPVRIRAGSLGPCLPRRDLIVSRQHRILIRADITHRSLGARDVLVPAIKLVTYPGIDIAEDVESVTYWHMLLDQHEVVFADGAPAESLFTGPEALKGLSAAARQEIQTLFPEISSPEFTPQSIRPVVERKHAVMKLLDEHLEANLSLSHHDCRA
ncbi:Hint domain-containing protein [Paracoccus sp. Z330]|uniref:Hint domain-containing protein n=1 Tax=Paracoccus onchidii TaxID=3017813 RepID=A0ABT4ZJV8_9RHOB|nr:Hint domain-containing protein [Paracoccus onchidii]MDB6179598.1 Hint domain-containing protein [Paracoccus onchidii]